MTQPVNKIHAVRTAVNNCNLFIENNFLNNNHKLNKQHFILIHCNGVINCQINLTIQVVSICHECFVKV